MPGRDGRKKKWCSGGARKERVGKRSEKSSPRPGEEGKWSSGRKRRRVGAKRRRRSAGGKRGPSQKLSRQDVLVVFIEGEGDDLGFDGKRGEGGGNS